MKVSFIRLFIIVFSFAFFNCERDDPSPKPAPNITTVFHDDFSDNKYKWPETNTDTSHVYFQNDSMFIQEKFANFSFYCYQEIQVDTSKNFAIKSAMKWKSGVTNYGYGIEWGLKDYDNKYYFLVSADGAYTIGHAIEGSYSAIVPWTYFGGVNPQSNLLEIKKEGKKISFFINNQKAYSTTFRPIFGNGIGLVVTERMDVGIDYLNVTQW